MPLYDYRCPDCGVFEMYAGREEREVDCQCGQTATRRPFSGVPYLKGETVPRQIPEEAYRNEAQKRQLNSTWGGAERSMEMLRSSYRTDEAKSKFEQTGFKQVDMKNMEALT